MVGYIGWSILTVRCWMLPNIRMPWPTPSMGWLNTIWQQVTARVWIWLSVYIIPWRRKAANRNMTVMWNLLLKIGNNWIIMITMHPRLWMRICTCWRLIPFYISAGKTTDWGKDSNSAPSCLWTAFMTLQRDILICSLIMHGTVWLRWTLMDMM